MAEGMHAMVGIGTDKSWICVLGAWAGLDETGVYEVMS